MDAQAGTDAKDCFGRNLNESLKACENGHRRRCGEGRFCYVAVEYRPGISTDLWRLALTATDISGYVPLSDDWFLGSRSEMRQWADKLNSERLHLTKREAARIVASSMAHSAHDRRA